MGTISILRKHWHYNRQQTTSLLALDLKRNMLSTIMFKNPTEVCTQVLLSHCFLWCPWVGIFHLEKEVHLRSPAVHHSLCRDQRRKAMGGKIQWEFGRSRREKMQENACAFTWRACKNVCIYSHVFPLYHRGKMTRTLSKKIVSLESLSG